MPKHEFHRMPSGPSAMLHNKNGAVRRTTEGRPLIKLPGSRDPSSEISITVSVDRGRLMNIPSVHGGTVRTAKESMRRVNAAKGKDPETGRRLPVFTNTRDKTSIPDTMNQALSNAALRSGAIREGQNRTLRLKPKKR